MATKIIKREIEAKNVSFKDFKDDFSKTGQIDQEKFPFETRIALSDVLARNIQVLEGFKDILDASVKNTPYSTIEKTWQDAGLLGEGEKPYIIYSDTKGNTYTISVTKTGGGTEYDITDLLDLISTNPAIMTEYGLGRYVPLTKRQIEEKIKEGSLDPLKEYYSERPVAEGTATRAIKSKKEV